MVTYMRIDNVNSGMEFQKIETVEVTKEISKVKADNATNMNNNMNEREDKTKEKQLIKEISKMDNNVLFQNTSLKFAIHDKTNEVMVKVINEDTDEVIREIPSEKVLDMVAAMLERTGLFLDTKA